MVMVHPFNQQLTPRELEILTLCVEGLTDHEMAERLGISFKTVNHHLENMRRRFEARNRPHMVAIAFRRRLIE